MSSTRKADADSPFRQERYASSPALERGLMANLVAARCETLERPEDRELIYFLQLLSHREGGLKKVAAELFALYPDEIGTRAMLQFGTKGKRYTAEQVRAIRTDLSFTDYEDQFPLRGEMPDWVLGSCSNEYLVEKSQEAELHPDSYPVADFLKICQSASRLESDLKELCLNPERSLESRGVAYPFAPWYFPNAAEVLRRYHTAWLEQQRAKVVVTELCRAVWDTLDFALETRCLTLIDGFARTGKTFAAKAWCEAHPGRARYVQVPSTNDEIGFYRAIAKGLGVSINLNSKAQELRQRIEDVLQRGDLALVLDEAHYLWPNSNYRDAMPTRVNWVMTALVNQGVPVALVTTPQFLRTQKAVERKSSWTSEQFIGRIGHYEKLPDSLAESDLNKVAGALLPEGDDPTLEILVRYAQGSAKYLAGIESVVRRARYLAGKDGRTKVSRADIKRAVQESVIPSDSALAQAIAEPEKKSGRRRIAAPLQAPCIPIADRAGAGTEPAGETQFLSRNTTIRPAADQPRVNRALMTA
jgi:hypothetical protein